ncbi:MAG TPA: hypothetical protein VLB27_12450, partial [candidate division Zixibacteria bacterium]|nr:hypothetical protein [candidate division Zixibacteria bacterium]
SRYLAERKLTQRDIAGVISLGCRLNDSVFISAAPPSDYESSWAPPDRIDDFMKTESAYVNLEQRNAVVPASYVDDQLPPTLVLIAQEERFFPPVLRDGAEFVGRALVAGADAELKILADRRHMTALEKMVTPQDPTVQTVVTFIRAHQR